MFKCNTFVGILLWGMCLVPLLLAGDGELVILHTNDIHGAFNSSPANWVEERPLIGGFAPLSGALTVERSGNTPCLLMDAGDFMTGILLPTWRLMEPLGVRCWSFSIC